MGITWKNIHIQWLFANFYIELFHHLSVQRNMLSKMDPVVKIPSCVLITGANIGLGFECARQLALVKGVRKVLLACRNREKATAAKQELEQLTNKKIFEVVLMDVSDL